MKDDETLQDHNIEEGTTIQVVIRGVRTIPDSYSAELSPTPSNLGGLPTLLSIDQSDIFNPDLLKVLFNNYLIQRLNSERMKVLLTNNPEIKEVMERNPELNHIFNDSNLLRETLELAAHPSIIQEQARIRDRAFSNIESLPGGYNALERIYRDIQEPMLSASVDHSSRNPFIRLIDNTSLNNPQQGRENTQPLPNPWSLQSQSSSATTLSSISFHLEIENIMTSPGVQSQLKEMINNILQLREAYKILNQAAPNLQETIAAATTSPVLVTSKTLEATQTRNSTSQCNIGKPPGTTATDESISNKCQDYKGLYVNKRESLIPPKECYQFDKPENSIPPEHVYQSQMEQLVAMGFVNREKNLEALISSHGDIKEAMKKLLDFCFK